MIADLKPYPEYKESGQEWLGHVPKHWELSPGHAAFDKRKIPNHGLKENTVLSLSYGRIKVKPTDKQHGLVPESYETYQIVDEGNIIIRGTDLQNDHTSLRIGLVRNRGIISSAYLCLQCRDTVTPEYGYQILNTFDLTKAIYRYGSGLRQNLDHGEIKRLPIFLPPVSEQAAIVRFLDHWNGRLEKAIRSKRRVIALLQEQKQAIIHRAVTRGLDPNVKLKDSRIPWLGEIPQHWGISFLKMRYSVELGKMLDAKRITGRHLIPYLRNRDVQWDKVRVEDLPLMDIVPSEFSRYTVKKGDLLVCEGGQVGRCAFWNNELPICGYQKALHRIRANDPTRDVPRFFFYQMNLAAGLGVFAADGNENTIAHLTCEKLRSYRFPFPPFEEQEEIARFLDVELQTLNTAIARFEREITLLREYRTRLTADVVTGTLDVRAAAAQLPEEAEDEPLPDPETPEEETELEEFAE